jgi:phage/plasmid-associated DNA primase
MNNLPMSAEDGLFRRLILIKLARESFHDEGTVDIRFGEKLQGELPGILNRMLRGVTHLRKLGNFSVIEGHEQMIEEYKASANVIAEFLDTYFDPVPNWTEDVDVPIPTSDMFSAYMADVGPTRGIQLTRQRFGRLLGNQPLVAFQCMRTARTSATRLWTGLRLKKGYEFSYSEFDDKARIVRTSGRGEGKIGKNDEW